MRFFVLFKGSSRYVVLVGCFLGEDEFTVVRLFNFLREIKNFTCFYVKIFDLNICKEFIFKILCNFIEEVYGLEKIKDC